MRAPEFDAVVGPEVEGDERERLRRAHDALVSAGPLPELPSRLRDAPRAGRVAALPRRGRKWLPLAAAIAIAAFAGGYVAGGERQEAFAADYTVQMSGTRAAPGAAARIDVGQGDSDVNRPMRVVARGLDEGGTYELLLTHGQQVVASCGTFHVADDETVVYLNAPYVGRQYGWVVAPVGSSRVLLATEGAPRSLGDRA